MAISPHREGDRWSAQKLQCLSSSFPSLLTQGRHSSALWYWRYLAGFPAPPPQPQDHILLQFAQPVLSHNRKIHSSLHNMTRPSAVTSGPLRRCSHPFNPITVDKGFHSSNREVGRYSVNRSCPTNVPVGLAGVLKN